MTKVMARVLLVMLLWAGAVSAQCVDCKSQGLIFKCTAASSGGKDCTTLDHGRSCILDYPCEGRKHVAQDDEDINLEYFSIQDPTVLLEIAKAHPRFAATLAQHRLAIGWSQVHWIPFRLTAEDARSFLRDGSWDQKPPKIARSLRGKSIIYDINTTKSDDGSITLLLTVKKTFKIDPAYNSLRLDITPEGQIKNWQIQ